MHRGKPRRQRAHDRLDQPAILRRPSHIHRQHALGLQVIPGLLEELPGHQLPGNVGHAVGVHRNHVVTTLALTQAPPAVGHHRIEVGLAHAEELPAHPHDLRVDFPAVDGNRAENLSVLFGDSAGRQADQPQTPHALHARRRRVEEGRGQKVLPCSVSIDRALLSHRVDRVLGQPFVEVEQSDAFHLLNLYVVVGRLGLIDGVGRGLDRSGYGQPGQDNGEDRHP